MTSDVNPHRARLLAVEHEDWAGAGRLVEPLQDAGVEVVAVRPYKGDDVPTDAAQAGYDGVLVLGGSMAAWEDEVAPWLPATRTLLRTAVESSTPTLGICLGAQLLALAVGGSVTRGPAGLEVGVSPVLAQEPATDDALLGPVVASFGPSLRSVQWHGDAVTALPPGAVLLASSEQYPHQAYRIGARAWGVQYHPEVTRADWSAWVAGGLAALEAAGRDADELTAEVDAAEADLAEVARLHATSFAAVVRAAQGEVR